eukprot:gnl/Trimastix_PCT/2237.p1 GENE.gnl/Trimastix_PCT/2237~~gnl/Trimastix_PCT/2237.p1  ORF type:complete len:364 (+),score=112.24 gnl/Trimastix_PCT/2237:19-1110(+)
MPTAKPTGETQNIRMGCGSSRDSEEEDHRKRSAHIDAQLRKERRDEQVVQKLLLLGAGESGKSTIFKQMKIIHGSGYSSKERIKFREVIYSNVVLSIKALLQGGIRLGIPLCLEENRARAERCMRATEFSTQLAQDVEALWKDRGVQTAFHRANEFQLNDNTQYYFDGIRRIAGPDFVPTEQDVLRSRVVTTGIREMTFSTGELHIRMIDVGGQRNERKKWIHCFQNVTAVIFCASLSEYDQVLYEDEGTNRMQESLLLFEEICNCKWFFDTSIILFLNKIDLFEEKLKRADLRVCFPEFTGGSNLEAAKEFIIDRFCELNRSETKQIYPHITCATNTANIRFVFDVVKDIILQINLRGSGFF